MTLIALLMILLSCDEPVILTYNRDRNTWNIEIVLKEERDYPLVQEEYYD